MMINLHETSRAPLSLPEGSYVYQIRTIGADHIAAIYSDDHCRVFDANTLQPVDGRAIRIHEGVTCLVGADYASVPHMTAGRDGRIRGWDGRMGQECFQIEEARDGGLMFLVLADASTPFLSLAYEPSAYAVAAGTELVNSQVTVQIWDYRKPAKPVARYVESHSDDVTEVVLRTPSRLLSGSTDGLVNIYDTTALDEDEALVEVLNYGASVHHAGYLDDRTVFALSHDETLAVFTELSDINSGGDARAGPDAAGRRVQAFGDIRDIMDCAYAVDVLPQVEEWGGEALLAAGNHSERRLELVPLMRGPDWSLHRADALSLVGAHGEEVVRSVCIHQSTAVFTGGEDGQIRAWSRSVGDEVQEEPNRAEQKKKRLKKESSNRDKRFAPY